MLLASTMACGATESAGHDGGHDAVGVVRGALDCAWLASNNNCWRSTLVVVASCAPPSTEVGTLSPDGRTCTFMTGHTLRFDEPLTLPLPPAGSRFNFTLAVGGRTCLTFRQPDAQTYGATTSAGTVNTASDGSDYGAEVICPGGARYTTSDARSLLTCGDAGTSSGPIGFSYTQEPIAAVTFELLGVSGTGPVRVFRCVR